MADFNPLITERAIPPAIATLLGAFNKALFARACASQAELDELIDEFTATASISAPAEKLVARAGLRLLCSKCRSAEGLPSLEGSAPPTSSAEPGASTASSPSGAPALLSSSWQESWPAKLSPERTSALRKRFEDDYPTELLDSESFPSSRLLALTNKMISDKEIRWLPWKFRLSSKSQEDSLMMRPRKQARFSELSELLLDEAPAREIHEGPASFGLISQLLTLAANSVALCRGAHLGSLKLYNKKFLRLCFTKYDASSNLRGPTVMEAQSADKRCWELIAELVNLHNWKLDDALHELSEVRSDMSSLLAPRAFIHRRFLEPVDSVDTWRFQRGSKGNPKGGGKGLKGQDGKGDKGDRTARGGKGGKGKDNKGASQPGKWLSTLFMDGKRHTLCMRYQNGQCKDPSTCRYLHRCAVPKQDGTACGGNHPASQHVGTPH